MDTTWLLLLGALALPGVCLAAATGRPIPKPLPDHPGNIFLASENTVVGMPPNGMAGKNEKWRLTDYEGRTIIEGTAADGKAALGRLPIGYYELRRVSGGVPQAGRVTVGVIASLEVPTPLTSPVGIDVAAAWFYPSGPNQEGAASLCALAGINWVRDRLAWRDMESKRVATGVRSPAACG